MVANPAPLMMSAKTYCSSLIEAFIPGSLPLIIARERLARRTPIRLSGGLTGTVFRLIQPLGAPANDRVRRPSGGAAAEVDRSLGDLWSKAVSACL
jgi:hypothetical protein